MITFLISGLWHGASWNFIIWGAIHGFYLICAIVLAPYKKMIFNSIPLNFNKNFIRSFDIIIVFILVSFAWIFFRANTTNDAIYIIQHLFSAVRTQLHNLQFNNEEYLRKTFYLGSTFQNIVITACLILFLFLVEFIERKGHLRKRISSADPIVKWACYSGIALLILYFGAFNNNIQFIYFQF
jgi:alginate O-acetyltransferase complex protein AlgI